MEASMRKHVINICKDFIFLVIFALIIGIFIDIHIWITIGFYVIFAIIRLIVLWYRYKMRLWRILNE